MKYRVFLFLLLFYAKALAQQTPVQVSAFLNPPYSLDLHQYYAPGSNLLQVQLLLTDLTKLQYPVKLRITLDGVGITIRTRASFVPPPIPLSGGEPYLLTPEDLQPYLRLENLEFLGFSQRDYQRLGMLPEGFWRFKVQVLDYNRGSVVSNTAMAQAWMVLMEPPALNYPMKEEKLLATAAQNIQFSWSPRQISPNSSLTEYTLQLYEILPEGTDPNLIAAATQPYFETTTYSTVYFYTISDPMLMPGRQYAWRVRAENPAGFDRYKNGGNSEVRMFQWGDGCDPMMNVTLTPYKNHVRIDWDPYPMHTGYKIRWHSINPGATIWEEETQLEYHQIRDLRPGETIALQIAGMCGTVMGPYTPEATVTIPYVDPVHSNFECGKPEELIPLTGAPPLYVLLPGDVVTGVAGWEFIVEEINEPDGSGIFNGTVRWIIPWFLDGRLKSTLENVQVNEDYQMTHGEVVSTYNPKSPFVVDTRKSQEEPETATGTATPPTTTANLETEITIPNPIDTLFINEEGKIVVKDTAGNQSTYQIPKDETGNNKPMTFTDSAGNTYTVDEAGKVTKEGESEISENTTDSIAATQPRYSLRDPEIAVINQVKSEFVPEKERLSILFSLKDTLNLTSRKLDIFTLSNGDSINFKTFNSLSFGDQNKITDNDNKEGWKGYGNDNKLGDDGEYILKLSAIEDDTAYYEFHDFEIVIIYAKAGGIWKDLNADSEMTALKINSIRARIDSITNPERKVELFTELQEKVPYHNQRDNDNAAADYMCNLTSLAMCLEMLGVSNPSSTMQFEDYLESIRIAKNYGERTATSTRKKIAESLGKNQAIKEWPTMTKTYLTNFLNGLLSKGYGVMISMGGHLVRVEGVSNQGIIVDDPYGQVSLLDRYSKGNDSYGQNVNSTGDNSTRGENNIWKWGEVNEIKFKYIEWYY